MILLLIYSASIHRTVSITNPPIASSLGDNFRSGEASMVLSSSNSYNLEVPYAYALSSNSVGLALSMIDYSQTFDASNTIHYYLYENTPSASNSTHAVFQIYLGYLSLTTRVKVKYLACPTALFSNNF